MLRLRRDLHVNLDGAAIIVDLVEQLEGLERELARRRGGS
jgi:MerR HTH family regulatory protein